MSYNIKFAFPVLTEDFAKPVQQASRPYASGRDLQPGYKQLNSDRRLPFTLISGFTKPSNRLYIDKSMVLHCVHSFKSLLSQNGMPKRS